MLVHATPTQADAIVRAMKCAVAGESRLQWAIADMSRCHMVSIGGGGLRLDDLDLWPSRDAPY